MDLPYARRGIGLLGGTFDPVHNGHLCLAREALAVLRLARVDFLPAAAPWQKSRVTAEVDERVRMLEAATEDEEDFRVNLLEVLRGGVTYTIDTLREMRRITGPGTPVVLLLGADQWRNFHTWKDWPEMLRFASIAVCSRDGKEPLGLPEVEAWAAPHETAPYLVTAEPCGLFARFSMPAHAASSTEIRRTFARLGRAGALEALQTWLPWKVSRHIALRHTY